MSILRRLGRGVAVACAVTCTCALLGSNARVGAYAAMSNPDQYCPIARADHAARSAPPSLVPAVTAAFRVRMSPAEVERQTVIRCANGRLLACMIGGNLNCGQADTRKTSVGGDAWCRQNPGAPFIPMFTTGHTTIYAWHCEGPHAVPRRQVQRVDAEGFVAGFWRQLKD